MKCPKCGGRQKITHVFQTNSGKTSTGVCGGCGKRFTNITFTLGESGEECDGAAAVATAITSGEVSPEIRRRARARARATPSSVQHATPVEPAPSSE